MCTNLLKRLSLAALLLLAACGEKSRLSDAPGLLPSIPGRDASGLTEYGLSGKDAEARSGGALEQGNALVLPGSAGGFEYALYRFNPGGEQPDSVSVLLEEASTTGAWIGLADYSSGRWEFTGPYTKQKTLSTDDPRFRSPAGNIWVAVLVRQESATVSALSVRTLRPDNLSPLADLQADPASGDAPLTVQFDAGGSSDPDGEILEYAWDFDGNGTYEEFSDGPTVAYDYATPGVRLVKVRVMDDELARATATVQVAVSAVNNASPTADFTRTPVSGNIPLSVEFDGGGSADSDGTIVRYDWDFDGNGTWDAYDSGPAVSHVYATAGAFVPVLRVTDNAGAQALKSRTVNASVAGNASPSAALAAAPDSGDAPLSVTLDASGSADSDGSIVNYEWDFNGDGIYDGYGADPAADFTYSSAGIFSATVRVSDDDGAQALASVDVNVSVAGNNSPTAALDADLTSGDAPLAVSFDGSGSSDSDGSIVRYDWDFDGDGVWDAYDGPDALEHTYSAGSYTAKLRVTDDAGAQDIDSLSIAVNALPVAQFSFDSTTVDIGQTATLDGSSSSDSDGSLTKYEWDLDGNGTFETDTSTTSYAQTSFTTAGIRTLGLKVTDDATPGASATYFSDLLVSGWAPADDPESLNYVYHPSLAIVNGRPAIAYHDYQANRLKYIRAANEEGTAWGTAVIVDDPADLVGSYPSLVVVSGYPAISYYNITDGDLYYVRADDPNGADWGSPVGAVVSADDVGKHSSMAVVNGNPAISYFDDSDNDMFFVRATNATGTAWGTPVGVDPTGPIYETSLAVVDGMPAIAFRGNDGLGITSLRFVRASEANGATWGSITTLLSDGMGEMLSPSLAVINGIPCVACRQANGNHLRFYRSNNAAGSSWAAGVTVVSGNVGNDRPREVSLCEFDGKPAIAFFRSNYGTQFVRAADSLGALWESPENVIGTHGAGGVALAPVSSGLGVAIASFPGADFKFARYY